MCVRACACVTLCTLVHACTLRDQNASDPLELELQVVVWDTWSWSLTSGEDGS